VPRLPGVPVSVSGGFAEWRCLNGAAGVDRRGDFLHSFFYCLDDGRVGPVLISNTQAALCVAGLLYLFYWMCQEVLLLDEVGRWVNGERKKPEGLGSGFGLIYHSPAPT
jgi:hypothetical protein